MMKNSLLRIAGVVIVLALSFVGLSASISGQPVVKQTAPAKSETPAPVADNPISNDGGVNGGIVKVVDNSSAGDPVKGKKLFSTFQPTAGMACNACHRVDTEKRLVGPGLLNVSIRAAHRVDGLSAEAYIRQSILDPSVYVVDRYQNIMPKTFRKAFTDAQLNDLIAYLMTLK